MPQIFLTLRGICSVSIETLNYSSQIAYSRHRIQTSRAAGSIKALHGCLLVSRDTLSLTYFLGHFSALICGYVRHDMQY